MNYRFRPLPDWPYPATKGRRSKWTFRAGWEATLELLDHELREIDGKQVVIGAGFRERDLRLDGLPRSDARAPTHPGIELSFDSKHGRITYHTDSCERWEHNVRCIALGLEALRAVDRYGITEAGEQYAGFKVLPPGDGPSAARGARIVAEHDGMVSAALKATHPDHGGNAKDFADVQVHRQLLDSGRRA